MNTRTGFSNGHLAALFVFLFVAGCATDMQHLTKVDSEAISDGRKSLVLIGLTADWNGKRVDPIGLLMGGQKNLAIAALDEGSGLRRIRASIAAPSDASGRRWVYMVLSPGSYYIWGVPPELLPRDVRFQWRDTGGFLLQVPPKQSIVYAGTLHFDCGGSQFLLEKFFKRLRPDVRDEIGEAKEFAHNAFKEWPELSVSLLQTYEEQGSKERNIFPALLLTQTAGVVTSPDWKKRSIQKWTLTSPMSSFFEEGGGGGIGALGIAAAYLAYLPIGLLLGNVFGEADMQKWGPCVKNLEDMIVNLDPAGMLRRSLAETLENRAVPYKTDQTTMWDLEKIATDKACATLLFADVQRIQLRECGSGLFSVEVAMRVRIWHPEQHSFVFDRTVVYRNPQAEPLPGEIQPASRNQMILPFPAPYEFILPTVSPSRPLQDYCGPGAQEVFSAEITSAIQAAVNDLIHQVETSDRN